jgi:ABC-type transporter Mla subunit MlaD
MARSNKSAEFKTGMVVLLGIVILVIGLFLVSGGFDQLRPKRDYTAYFRDGGSVSAGAAVFLGGQRAGTVKSVEVVTKQIESKELRFIAVTVELYADLDVPSDSVFSISKTITGTVTVNIASGDSATLADSKTDFFGRTPDTFEQVVSKAGELLREAQAGVEEFAALMRDARGLVAKVDIDGIQQRIDTILARIESAAGTIDEIVRAAREPVRGVLTKAEATVGNFEDLSAQLKRDWPESLHPRVQAVLDEVKALAADARTLVAENRETIKAVLQNFEDASRRVAPILVRLESLSKNLDETVIEVRPELAATLQNARRAMGNFESLTEDLKTAPWKLINKPSDKESDAVHIYNAARLYVDAAGRIADNIESLDSLRKLGVLDDPSKKDLIERALSQLQDSLGDFEARQKRLADAIAAARGK